MSLARRRFLQGASILAASTLLHRKASAPTERPNILFCMADDWFFGHASICDDRAIRGRRGRRIFLTRIRI